jgi:hypothetical protein
MFGSVILEVAIGVIFVFILVSIICTALREALEGFLKTRSAYLEHAIRELLHDKDATGLARNVFEHPLIFGLFLGEYKPPATTAAPGLFSGRGRNLPAYIPSRNFAVALMDMAARGPATDLVTSATATQVVSVETIRNNILNIGNAPVQRVLLNALDSANGSLDKAQANLEAWYDSAMDRVSGRYKRASQTIIFWIGLVVAVFLNIDALRVAKYLYSHDAERTALVARAETAARDSQFLKGTEYAQARSALDSIGLPIGWDGVKLLQKPWTRVAVLDRAGKPRLDAEGKPMTRTVTRFWEYVFSPILGWLMVAAASMLGAPFWFDVLNKVMVIRSTVKPHEKSPEEDSEDRQIKARTPVAPAAPAAPAASGGVASGAGAVGQAPAGAGGAAAAVAPAAPADPMDNYNNLEGCGVEPETLTDDEDLPPAEGGVA